MNTKEKPVLWYILGALGGIFVAAGDWLLGCIPLNPTNV